VKFIRNKWFPNRVVMYTIKTGNISNSDGRPDTHQIVRGCTTVRSILL